MIGNNHPEFITNGETFNSKNIELSIIPGVEDAFLNLDDFSRMSRDPKTLSHDSIAVGLLHPVMASFRGEGIQRYEQCCFITLGRNASYLRINNIP